MAPSRARYFSLISCCNISQSHVIHRVPTASRSSSTASGPNTSASTSLLADLPPRWLGDLKRRIGYCISFGLTQDQVDEAGNILRIVARDWKELVAGSEGYLTGKRRAGFEGREVVWGEMVSDAT